MAGTPEGARKAREKRQQAAQQAAQQRKAREPTPHATKPLAAASDASLPLSSDAPPSEPTEFVRRDQPAPAPARAELPPEPADTDSQAEPIQAITPNMVRSLYGMLGAVEGRFATAKFPMLPADKLTRIFSYSEADLRALTPPTTAVLNKYAGAVVVRWKEELDLGLTLVFVHQQKIEMLQQLAESLTRQRPQPVQEMPRANGRDQTPADHLGDLDV